jgi:hypothetical protein
MDKLLIMYDTVMSPETRRLLSAIKRGANVESAALALASEFELQRGFVNFADDLKFFEQEQLSGSGRKPGLFD